MESGGATFWRRRLRNCQARHFPKPQFSHSGRSPETLHDQTTDHFLVRGFDHWWLNEGGGTPPLPRGGK